MDKESLIEWVGFMSEERGDPPIPREFIEKAWGLMESRGVVVICEDGHAPPFVHVMYDTAYCLYRRATVERIQEAIRKDVEKN